MPTTIPRTFLRLRYEEAAREYAHNQTVWDVMESTTQAQQRAITGQSFSLISVKRPDIHCFSDLLVQYPLRGKE